MANSAVRGVPECHLAHHQGAVHHFLTWLELIGIAVEVINGAVIKQFLQYDCECCGTGLVSFMAQTPFLSEDNEVRSVPGAIEKSSHARYP